MKKLIVSFVAATLVGSVAFATEQLKNDTDSVATKIVQTQNVQPKMANINLYQEASDTSKILATINVHQKLIPFFKKNDWIKVGDPSNGQVGWINKEQYRKAMNTIISQSIQTIYVEQNDTNNGKPQITVYQNGEKVTGTKATEIYKQVQKQQNTAQKKFLAMQKSMNDWINQQNQILDNFPVLQPIVIIENGAPEKTNIDSKKGKSESK